MQKRRLQRARLTEKRTYKMYKKGRFWLVAGLSTFTLSTGIVQMRAHADTTVGNTTTQQGATAASITAQSVTLTSHNQATSVDESNTATDSDATEATTAQSTSNTDSSTATTETATTDSDKATADHSTSETTATTDTMSKAKTADTATTSATSTDATKTDTTATAETAATHTTATQVTAKTATDQDSTSKRTSTTDQTSADEQTSTTNQDDTTTQTDATSQSTASNQATSSQTTDDQTTTEDATSTTTTQSTATDSTSLAETATEALAISDVKTAADQTTPTAANNTIAAVLSQQSLLMRARSAAVTVATLNDATKTYDGKTTTPNQYTVTLADGTKAPADWAATSTANVYTVTDLTDIDTTSFSAGVGTYAIAFSTTGLDKLAQANSSADITAANVVTGTLTITQAPVPSSTITIGSTSIDYGDAKPSTYTITVPSQYNVPSEWTLTSTATDGTTNTYSIASTSGDITIPTATASGTYQLALSDQGMTALQQANPNEAITSDTVVTGTLTIASHDIITMGASTVTVNKTTSTVQVTVNSRSVVVPSDWKVYYNDSETDSVVYSVPVADTTYPTAVNTAVIGQYTITLTDAALADLTSLNAGMTFDRDNVGDGVVLVKASSTVNLSPNNFGAQASYETPVTVLTISHAWTRGIDLSYGQGLYLVLPLLNMAQSSASGQLTVDNLTEYVIVPAGFKVASTASDGKLQVATDPVATLTAAIETMLSTHDVTYQGLTVTQLTDYKGRQTFQVHFDQTVVYNGNAFESLIYTLLPTIAVQSSGVTSGLIGNQVSSPDSAVVYVTDDPDKNEGSYSLNLQSYTNIDSVADALGIADAVTISSGFTTYLYSYKLSAKSITDTYQLVSTDGTDLGQVTYTGDSGATYVPLAKLPTTIDKDGVTYYLNVSAVAATQTYAGDDPSTYIVTYQRYVTTTSTDTTAAITMALATKVYDNDATTDPSSYTVYLPTEYTAPSTWTVDDTATAVTGTTAYTVPVTDVDVTAINQNVGSYAVTLNATGMAALAAANPGLLIANKVNVGGTYTITKRPATITLPDTILWANGQEQNITPVVSNVVTGQTLGYTLTAGLTKPGTETVTATLTNAAVNDNYDITIVPGKLTVGDVTVVYQYQDYDATSETYHLATTATGTVTHGTDRTAADYLTYSTTGAAKTGYTLVSDDTGYAPNGTLSDVGGQVVYIYQQNKETATVTFMDTTTNQPLGTTVQLTGGYGSTATYSPADQIAAYVKAGYVLVSNGVPTTGITFGATGNDYVVELAHGTQTVTVDQPGSVDPDTLRQTSQRTIHYVYADQTKAADDQVQTVAYTRTATVDTVDQTVLSYGNWTTADATYAAVTSPTLIGYTPDIATVAAATATKVGEALATTVTYAANSESITVQFVDETAGNTVLKSVPLNGYYGNVADYTATADIAKYTQLGYVLTASDLPDQLVYTEDQPVYTIKLAHQRVTVSVDHPGTPGSAIDPTSPDGPKYPAGTAQTDLQKTVTRTIDYQYADGTQAATPVQQSVTFDRTATFDMVTGDRLTYSDWAVATGQSAVVAAVTSPTITGYQASSDEVAATTLTSQSQPQTIVITYAPQAMTATVTFIDATSGQTLTAIPVTGDYGTTSTYSPAAQITAYEQQGYRLADSDVPTTGIQFDQVGTPRNYTVKLTHRLTTVTPSEPGTPGQPIDGDNPDGPKYPAGTGSTDLTMSKQRTITYVYADGRTAAPTATQNVAFYRNATVDQVTQRVTYSDWLTADAATTGSYAAMTSPTIVGYTPDTARVASVDVGATAADTQAVVTYQAKTETATVTYIDATTNQQLGTTITLTGAFGTPLDYQTTAQIAAYVQAGYVLMGSDYPADATFDQDDAVQAYTVYLAHNKTVITAPTQLTKAVTQTIHYQDQAGKALLADTVRTLTFSRSGVSDAVTGVDTYSEWTPTTMTFTAIAAPTLAGYHAVTAGAQAVTITAASGDDVQTVTYAADEPVKPTEPSKPVKPTEPTKPTEPAKPTKPGQPTKPEKPAEPVKPTEPAKPVKPTKPTKPGQPTTTVKSDDHVQPGKTGQTTPAPQPATGTLTGQVVQGTTTNQARSSQSAQTKQSNARLKPATAAIKSGVKATSAPTHQRQSNAAGQLPQTSDNRQSGLMATTLGLTLATFLLSFGGVKRKRHHE
ncbi:mucin-binding protein [Lactiplantibacillus pentosus]|uniref:mucin-binding protein n=1 Tax=Lactiplantibacillus pentosus TaxID=1589 RepID=UPI001B35DAF3|nr:MBG domain-containing protein [Lactiplantibacillus pentosus]MBQ0835811.1 KxYKxGKxW signal peptide domain-containing protein [Lactiplantibacillus pentosus]MBU7465489.1 KxYKxGKxW signal peptide domain-containing protein [Lactiplantibacillus pentosus]MBU7491418.1 KxYKxGKxW signal peptide domain-containing protein [Lactiplantibacillus pentosus]MBU7527143.1 KxYKxGKxW signal peptide domain-containing protein [Lactiplantibacillus pentosus]MDT6967049.1 MBG domain-containing protein [Lactiplantibaci